jgi:phosphoglycolate phosphatase-like HAD superfamily hydrolase
MTGRTDRAIILETLELAGISEPRRYVDPFIAGLRAHAPAVRETVALRGHALPGAAAALTALATADAIASSSRGLGSVRLFGRLHQSVLTGNIRTVAEVKLSALGLREALDLCIGAYGDDHEVRAELVHVARRRAAAVHGRQPTDFAGSATVVIGDTPLDVEAALATDARAIGIASGRYSVADLAAAGADMVLPDLTDIRLILDVLLPPVAPVQVAASTAVPPAAAVAAAAAAPAAVLSQMTPTQPV